jgi:hypothetical protein
MIRFHVIVDSTADSGTSLDKHLAPYQGWVNDVVSGIMANDPPPSPEQLPFALISSAVALLREAGCVIQFNESDQGDEQ